MLVYNHVTFCPSRDSQIEFVRGHAYKPDEAEMKQGKVKTTDPASKYSIYRNNSAELLLEEAFSFQLKRKESTLILTGEKSPS